MLCALLLWQAAPVWAQDAPGGRQITLGIDSRLIAQRNAAFIPAANDGSRESRTRLSFGLRSETPASFVSLDASAGLILIDGAGQGRKTGLTDPTIAAAFRHEAAGSFISGTAYWRDIDLTQDPMTDFLLPPVGTRRSAGGTLTYRWGEDRRAGFGLNATFADTAYRDAPGQIDNIRYGLGGDVRLDLTEVARLTIGLTRSRFDPEVGATRDSTALAADLEIDRPRGPVTFSASLTDTPDGRRSSVEIGRRLDLPDGVLSVRLGVAHGVAGDTRIVGALGYSRDLVDGRISVNLSRSVTSGEDDREVTETRASFGYGRELTARTRLIFDLDLGHSRARSTGVTIRSGTVSATLSHELDENWALDAGFRLRARKATGQPSATNPAIFIGIRREIVSSF